MKKILKSKKAAFELSMTTVVIIVLSMTMLILGITLVTKIMKMGTGIIDITDTGVRAKLNKALGDEGRDLTIGLPDKTAVISPGSKGNAPLVVNTESMGAGIGPEDLKYEVSLSEIGDCIEKNGGEAVEGFFITPLGKGLEFEDYEAGIAYTSISMQIPKTAKLCSQKVSIEISDNTKSLGKTSFTLEVAKTGFGIF